MRAGAPLSSTQMRIELEEIGEHIISLLGYDAQVYDDKIDVSGVYDTIDAVLDSSGGAAISDRMEGTATFPTPIYTSFGSLDQLFKLMRTN